MIRRFGTLCLGLALAGLVVRLTLRDRVPVLAVLYYATPPVVSGLLLLLFGLTRLQTRAWKASAAAGLAALACCGWWIAAAVYPQRAAPQAENSIRLLLWNTGRVRADAPELLERVSNMQPDLAAFVESGDMAAFVPGALPAGYRLADLGGGLTVMARGSIRDTSLTRFGGKHRAGACTVDLAGKPVRLLVVDLDSNPFVSKPAAMRSLREFIHRVQPDLICGDFNTPADSVWFEDLRRDHVHAFEMSGTGLHATWPNILPVLAIDHIWVGGSFAAHTCRTLPATGSDHRMVMAEVSPR